MRYVKYPRTLILLTGMCAAIGSGYIFVSSEMQRRNDTLLASRNFYGSLRVDHDGSENDLKVTLMHGVIVHGAQFVDLTDCTGQQPTMANRAVLALR